MEEIIAPVERQLIIDELTSDKFLRHTSKLHNQLYLVDAHNSPHTMREIGRLRELAFRTAGGGTGREVDVDAYDTADTPFQQLVLWDPEDREIIAGYRLMLCKNARRDEQGRLHSATSHLFHLSEKFYQNYLPTTMELGRSFVQPHYQRGASRKGLFSMDNLWDGLGAVVMLNPDVQYLFGKVTMYPQYHREARNILLSFLHYFFPDDEKLVYPHKPWIKPEELAPFTPLFEAKEYKEAYGVLNREIRSRGENIPPLINSYMGLSNSMKTFGTALNENFGKVEETGIFLTISDVYASCKERHMESYYDFNEYTGPELKLR
ncbi:MAG: GNAT family N-acetyltransferase [Owenweeksia sp.]|nr:GNAT family N-acetyltransferase [Owenweeksia sp.]